MKLSEQLEQHFRRAFDIPAELPGIGGKDTDVYLKFEHTVGDFTVWVCEGNLCVVYTIAGIKTYKCMTLSDVLFYFLDGTETFNIIKFG